MKYVMLRKQGETLTTFWPILFPSLGVHSMIAEAILDMPGMEDFVVHSAGYWCPVNGVSGSSETLCMEHDPADQGRILMANYGGLFE